MISFGKFVTKHKKLIVVMAFLLMIPSVIGMANTRINYDILSYLPSDIETMVGQDILVDQFGSGAFSMVIVEGMENKDVVKLKEKIENVDHVSTVIWYDSLLDLSVPMTMLPDEIKDVFNAENSTLMVVMFEGSTSDDTTIKAIEEIRTLAKEQVFVSGMSSIVADTKTISIEETPVYVLIASVLSIIILGIFMDSFVIPIIFMLSIGMAILFNLGSNVFLGEISYITKALTAVLQLAVTMDYSIFLLHSYEENKERFSEDKNRAMSHAISNTISSVVGSSITTVAGFLALCFMSFTLGKDIGIVMAKGVIIGVICCVTVLPSMILLCDKLIEKTKHKTLMPNLSGLSRFVTKHYIIFAVIFAVLLVPAIYGNNHTKVYYNLDASLPDDLPGVMANNKLKEDYDMNPAYMLLIKNDVDSLTANKMVNQIEEVEGVKMVLGLNSLLGPAVPQSMLPETLTSHLMSDEYQMVLIASEYAVATDEVNAQIDEINSIVKSYSEESMIVGEAPCTKDLIDITAVDFKNVSIASIGVIFVIILFVFKSISLPIILVAVIELAIFINMGLPYYTGVTIPFVASIVIGTIQLGATVDYAILMTTKYKKERNSGAEKGEAIAKAHETSVNSVIVSGLSFFAATFGVGLYSKIDMISSLCSLMSRGAIISMFVVIFILPSMFMIFDKIICKTSIGFGPNKN